jgi:hypothetical protein
MTKRKSTNSDVQNKKHKIKDLATRAAMKTVVERKCYGKVSSSCFRLRRDVVTASS